MHSLKNKTSALLIFVFLQFSAPILNVAAELPCCDNQEIQCCQSEFPARMVCCIAAPEHGLDESTPAQMVLRQQTSQQTVLVLAPPAFIFYPSPPEEPDCSAHLNSFNSSLYGNDLYQHLSTLLI